MSGRTFLRLFLVLAVLAAAGYFAWREFQPVATVATVFRDIAVDGVVANVTVSAGATPPIVAEFGGRVLSANLKMAEPVKAGDVLVEMDTSRLRIDMQQTEDDLTALNKERELGSKKKFELETAKDQLKETERLLGMGLAPAVQAEQARRAVQTVEQLVALETIQLEQRIRTLENERALQKLQLVRMTIKAPVDGVISRVFITIDSLVGPGTVIAELVPGARLVEAKVSEDKFKGIKQGMPGRVRFSPYGHREWYTTVDRLLPAGDAQTQRFSVFLQVKDMEPEMLIPGLTGEASIELARRENALVVPLTALKGDSVLVVKGNLVEQRPVKIGFTSLSVVEILEGLTEGEMVIVDDLDLFRDGQSVKVRAAK